MGKSKISVKFFQSIFTIMYGRLITCLCNSPMAFSMLALTCTKQFCGFRFIKSGPRFRPRFLMIKNLTLKLTKIQILFGKYLQYILLLLRFSSFRWTSSSIKHYFLCAILPCWFRIPSGFRNRIQKDLSGFALQKIYHSRWVGGKHGVTHEGRDGQRHPRWRDEVASTRLNGGPASSFQVKQVGN